MDLVLNVSELILEISEGIGVCERISFGISIHMAGSARLTMSVSGRSQYLFLDDPITLFSATGNPCNPLQCLLIHVFSRVRLDELGGMVMPSSPIGKQCLGKSSLRTGIYLIRISLMSTSVHNVTHPCHILS